MHDDETYEALTLAYWKKREPELDEVSISVRRRGEMVRFILLRPGQTAVNFNPDDCREALSFE